MQPVESPPENGTQIQDVRLDAIREVVPDADLEYKEVTVPGHLEQVISPSTFSISDPDDPLAGELLMVNKSGKGGMESGAPVKVTGIVYWGFNAADVKQETGIELDETHTSNGRVTPKSCPPESTPKSNTRVIV